MRNALSIILLACLLPGIAVAQNVPVDYYVDPTSGSDATGDGTSHAAAWATIQHALDNITQGTYGDAINIQCDGTSSLSSGLDLSTYGTTGSNKPLILRAYDAAAKDWDPDTDDHAEIELDAGVSLFAAGNNYIMLHGLEVHGADSTNVVQVGAYCVIDNCHLYDGTRGLYIAGYSLVRDCWVHSCSTEGIYCGGTIGSDFIGNYLDPGAGYGIYLNSTSSMTVARNIFIGPGLKAFTNYSTVEHNTFLGDGTGVAYYGIGGTYSIHKQVDNNLIEGYATGMLFYDGGVQASCRNNSIYNCTANFGSVVGDYSMMYYGNESLASSPFAKSGSATYANREAYFAPLDVGDVRAGRLDRGAIQHEDSGGGGETSHVWIR